jgi:hypothetical protein
VSLDLSTWRLCPINSTVGAAVVHFRCSRPVRRCRERQNNVAQPVQGPLQALVTGTCRCRNMRRLAIALASWLTLCVCQSKRQLCSRPPRCCLRCGHHTSAAERPLYQHADPRDIHLWLWVPQFSQFLLCIFCFEMRVVADSAPNQPYFFSQRTEFIICRTRSEVLAVLENPYVKG